MIPFYNTKVVPVRSKGTGKRPQAMTIDTAKKPRAMEELACFIPGNMILGVYELTDQISNPTRTTLNQTAFEILEFCSQMWLQSPTHLAPEIAYPNYKV